MEAIIATVLALVGSGFGVGDFKLAYAAEAFKEASYKAAFRNRDFAPLRTRATVIEAALHRTKAA